jgi:ATP-dependent DNA helicase Rep
VAQTVALASTLDERADEADVVTLSTLHAAKGLEWPHVWLAGVNEDVLPMRRDADADLPATEQVTRLEEERRLMYVGITRAKQTLVVSWQNRRKRGRDWVAGKPSRFVAEMALTQNQPTIDPRERLRALRAEFAQLKAEDAAS